MALVAIGILSWLGNWQLHRAHEKEALTTLFAARGMQQPLGNKDTGALGPEQLYRQAVLTGRYLPGATTLLDNRTHQGRAGYYVLSLFRVEGAEEVLWVNRGWVPAGRLRSELPDIETPSNTQRLEGEVRTPPEKGIYLGDEIHYRDWPQVIQYVDTEETMALLHTKILPFMIHLLPDPESGYIRSWPLVSVMPERHYGYAVQWFAMACGVVVIFIALNTRRIPPD